MCPPHIETYKETKRTQSCLLQIQTKLNLLYSQILHIYSGVSISYNLGFNFFSSYNKNEKESILNLHENRFLWLQGFMMKHKRVVKSDGNWVLSQHPHVLIL